VVSASFGNPQASAQSRGDSPSPPIIQLDRRWTLLSHSNATGPMQLWRHQHRPRRSKFKFWGMRPDCYAMRDYPNVFPIVNSFCPEWILIPTSIFGSAAVCYGHFIPIIMTHGRNSMSLGSFSIQCTLNMATCELES
jgi:hypothetical protein